MSTFVRERCAYKTRSYTLQSRRDVILLATNGLRFFESESHRLKRTPSGKKNKDEQVVIGSMRYADHNTHEQHDGSSLGPRNGPVTDARRFVTT